MAFIQVSAPLAAQAGGVLSADNSTPEKHIVVETLRQAAPLLGLPASVLATLETLLSCLPPKRNHHMVFASNATLTFRRNGLSDRTIRRHASALIEAGLIARNDSPNGKRYTRSSAALGKVLRFGFDLSPLFARMQELASLAADALRLREQEAFFRTALRAEAQNRLRADAHDALALDLLKTLRRKLSLEDLQALSLAYNAMKAAANPLPDPQNMSAKNGQNVRHHQNSKKELIDKKEPLHAEDSLAIPELLEICNEAAQFAVREIETADDVISHARMLAPMIGIDRTAYAASEARLGLMNTALTIWGLLQRQSKIKKLAAYFRTITTGAKSGEFNAVRFVRLSWAGA